MSGHLPSLNRESLRKLRQLALLMASQKQSAIPMRELLELAQNANAGVGDCGGVTVDFAATQELAEPIIVVRVPSSAGPSDALDCLTPREREISGLVAKGLLNKQIAAKLGISIATVKDHLHHVLEKTGLSNRAALAVAAAAR